VDEAVAAIVEAERVRSEQREAEQAVAADQDAHTHDGQ
jgi:hypothetical protein